MVWNVTSCLVTSRRVMSCHVMSCHVKLSCCLLCYVILSGVAVVLLQSPKLASSCWNCLGRGVWIIGDSNKIVCVSVFGNSINRCLLFTCKYTLIEVLKTWKYITNLYFLSRNFSNYFSVFAMFMKIFSILRNSFNYFGEALPLMNYWGHMTWFPHIVYEYNVKVKPEKLEVWI